MAKSFRVRIRRQEKPNASAEWMTYEIEYEPGMNITAVLQRIAANPVTVDNQKTAPVAYDACCLEEVCGACTMVINGQVRQACTALVDRLLSENPSEIELQPMTKFPVVRDLVVDRERLFQALKKTKAWIDVDGYYDMGPGPQQTREAQEASYPLSECMSCGCCLEACPEYTKVELTQQSDENPKEFQQRKEAAYDASFVGAHAISQVMLFNSHPIGKLTSAVRLDVLMQEGGIQNCGNAQNCVAVCP
ncbi:MAG: succinate dehydrogenase iron-sulfur subunit, partial [Planctomycetes bacterium]|nr:succinate dehydrogenase iron-sulfur subunit [Planctomycetota bacterium]